jgi:hypothetical protein
MRLHAEFLSKGLTEWVKSSAKEDLEQFMPEFESEMANMSLSNMFQEPKSQTGMCSMVEEFL